MSKPTISANKFLISEYCAHAIYMGWHLYLRDSKGRQQRNADGDWGWLRQSWNQNSAHALLTQMGIELRGDNSCDDGAYAELARRFPIPRQRIGGKPRGCIEVQIGERGEIVGVVQPYITINTRDENGIKQPLDQKTAEALAEAGQKIYEHVSRSMRHDR